MPVYDQKSFYRKLDALLSRIEIGAKGESRELLSTVLGELVNSFGKELSIINGRLYEIDGEDLVLRLDLRGPLQHPEGFRLPKEYPPLKLLFEHRCYIFDASTPGLDRELESKILGGTSSVAIVVGSVNVLSFGLGDGWEREKIEFCLNAIRNALNHKLRTIEQRANLEETRMIQRSLFPARLPEFAGYELAARSLTPEIVGGDFFDFIRMDEATLAIATGDASGHGLPAALLVRDVVTGLRMGVEKDMKIAPTLQKLNRVIHQSTLSTKFISLFYGELEANGNLTYVNAGHISPFLLLDRGLFRLDVGGQILGPLPEIKYSRGFAHIDKGGLLVAISDGLAERANSADEEFGEDRVAEILRSNREQPAEAIIEAIFQASFRHGVGDWIDDATAVVVRRLPS